MFPHVFSLRIFAYGYFRFQTDILIRKDRRMARSTGTLQYDKLIFSLTLIARRYNPLCALPAHRQAAASWLHGDILTAAAAGGGHPFRLDGLELSRSELAQVLRSTHSSRRFSNCVSSNRLNLFIDQNVHCSDWFSMLA